MSIEKRIEKLEKYTGAGDRAPKIWFIDEGEPRPSGIQEGDVIFIMSGENPQEMLEGIRKRLLGNIPSGGEDER